MENTINIMNVSDIGVKTKSFEGMLNADEYKLYNGLNTLQRIAYLKTFNPTKLGTQMCGGALYDEVDAKFRELMRSDFTVYGKTYNMIKLDYKMRWNNNKTRFGVHKLSWRNLFGVKQYTNKSIELSYYALENSDKKLIDWVDTILHEIAHAIDYEIRGTSNHDDEWKQVARAIGCNGERVSSNKITHKYKWVANCWCGAMFKRHKLTRQARYACCGKCSTPLQWSQKF